VSFDSLLTGTCTLQRYTAGTAADEFGHLTKTWADTAGVRCRVQQLGGKEMASGIFPQVATHRAYFRMGTDITHKDRVVYGGVTFEVALVDADTAGAGHHVEVMMKGVT